MRHNSLIGLLGVVAAVFGCAEPSTDGSGAQASGQGTEPGSAPPAASSSIGGGADAPSATSPAMSARPAPQVQAPPENTTSPSAPDNPQAEASEEGEVRGAPPAVTTRPQPDDVSSPMPEPPPTAMATQTAPPSGVTADASVTTTPGGTGAPVPSETAAPQPMEPVQLLVFTKTEEYRHESIGAGAEALRGIAMRRGFGFVATEDAAEFTDETLASVDVVIFLSTTGDVLDAEQEAAFERFIQSGKGYVGIHAASDTEYDWPWYGGLVGAYFAGHPAIQEATLLVEDATHVSTAHLPAMWVRNDEWYAFRSNPRQEVNVLMTLDEASYAAGDSAMGDDHPIAWYHEYDGGRAFYTALGHTAESYSEEAFLLHLEGAIDWASGRSDAPR